MRAAKFTTQGLRLLRDKSKDLSPDELLAAWKSIIESTSGRFIHELEIEVPAIPFETMKASPAGDAESAVTLYCAAPPDILGPDGFDSGFWVWLTLNSPQAWKYARARWSDAKVNERYLAEDRIRHALLRLWLGARFVAPDTLNSDKRFPEHVRNLFSNQDIFEQVAGRKLFREASMAKMFTSICANRELTGDRIKSFAKRLNAVLGIRFLPGLEFHQLFTEAEAVLDNLVRRST